LVEAVERLNIKTIFIAKEQFNKKNYYFLISF
jgi:hypothetical protein